MAFVSQSEVKVGVLVLLSVALTLALTLSVGNFKEYFSNTILISITVPSVVGLENFSPVTYSGVRIGTVTRIRFDEILDKAVIEAKINYDSPVSIDSKVRFTSAGLLSPLFVEISEGSSNKRIRDLVLKGEIERDKIILEADPYLSFGEIFAVAGDAKTALKQLESILLGASGIPKDIAGFINAVSQDVKVILSEIDYLLEQGSPKVFRALDRVDGLITGASEQVIPGLRDIRKTTAYLPSFVTDTQRDLKRLMNKTGGLIDTVSPEVVKLSGEGVQLLQDLRKRVRELQSSVSVVLEDADSLIVDNREDINRIVAHLEQTAANLNEITNELKKNPWRIIWKTDEKQPPGRVSPQWNPIQNDKRQ